MDFYKSAFKFRRIIDACGTGTILGGSLMSREVIEAMDKAAQSWVLLPDLLNEAEKRISIIADVESCMISSGCAACLTLSTAGCITGTNYEKISKLPNTEGMRNELVWQEGHYPNYISQYVAAGANIVVAHSSDAGIIRSSNSRKGENTYQEILRSPLKQYGKRLPIKQSPWSIPSAGFYLKKARYH